MFRLLLIAELCDVVCVMLHGVSSVCVVSTNACALSPSSQLLFFPSFLLSFFFFYFFFFSPLCSCIMWSGWTCIVIRPYGGGGVSESAWRRLNNSKQSFLSMGTPLGQTRLKCGSILVSQPDGGLTLNPDMTHGFWSQQLIFEKPFLCILFFIFTSFGCFTFFILFFLKSVMVQTDSSLLFFHYSELWYSSLVFAVPCILSLW